MAKVVRITRRGDLINFCKREKIGDTTVVLLAADVSRHVYIHIPKIEWW